jgi:acyl carrier protein
MLRMNHQFIEEQVLAIISKRLGDEVCNELENDTRLINYGVDSIDLLCILADLEKTFDITIANEDFFQKHAITLQSIYEYIAKILDLP